MSESRRTPLPMNGIGLSGTERVENDYYATHPSALEKLLEVESFSKDVWEPACGEGHLSEVLRIRGYNVLSTDLVDRGYKYLDSTLDFLTYTGIEADMDIITNPPYKFACEFTRKCISAVTPGHKIAMFLKLTFLETKERWQLFQESPPKTIYVFSSRQRCGRNGVFHKGDNAVAYAWFVWEKGFQGKPIIEWIL